MSLTKFSLTRSCYLLVGLFGLGPIACSKPCPSTHTAASGPLYASWFRTGDRVDLGRSINAADEALGQAAGEIWVDQQAGTIASTPVAIRSGHVLRFVQGGQYTFRSTITLDQGASILGSGGIASNTSLATVLQHDFDGDFIALDGNGVSQGGGTLRDLTLINIYRQHDSSGWAIRITGRSLVERAGMVLIDRVFVDGTDAARRWTGGLLMDGTLVGTESVRNFWIMNSRFTSSAVDCNDVKFVGVKNAYLVNTVTNNSLNGTQKVGITITGTNDSRGIIRSNNIHLTSCDVGELRLDYAENITVLGGAIEAVRNSANTVGTNLLMPGRISRPFSPDSPNLAPSSTFLVYLDKGTLVLGSGGQLIRHPNVLARLRQVSPQRILTTPTAIILDAEEYDTTDVHSTTEHPERLQVPISGKYQITAQVAWRKGTQGHRFLRIQQGATKELARTEQSARDSDVLSLFTVAQLSPTSYVTIEAWQDSGEDALSAPGGVGAPETIVTLTYVGE